jgi:hypothetical protein
MFHTLTGSLIILMGMGLIIFVFAVFVATVASWMWRKADERVAIPATRERSTAYQLGKAA